jgi:tetratricopeptide (TPR) repeat protein
MRARLALALLSCSALASAAELTGHPVVSGDGPSLEEIAREVAKKGFHAGEPIGAGNCAGCHADAAAQWQSSAHRFSSFNNPYYRVSVDEFRAERGAATSRFCANCHEPAIVQANLVDKPIAYASREAQAGLTCQVCHSVDAVPDLDGNGGFHVTNSDVPTKMPAHGARTRPGILAEPKFCGSCHKVGLDESITHDRWIRGQNDYDAWQASAASGNGAGAIWRPEKSNRCQDCHMPLEPALLGDAAAKNGMIRSHRFLGANSALPHLRGDATQLARIEQFLGGAVTLAAAWHDDRTVDLVMRNRRVGHRFPSGTMDSNEVWLEVEALDARGKVIGISGQRGKRGDLSPDAHLVRAQPVDKEGMPLLRRDPQHTHGVAFDASLSPADPQAVRFAVPAGTVTVRARLLYRKFTAEYARRACKNVPDRETRKRCEDLPIVEVSRTELSNDPARAPAETWQGLVDRGLALGAALADSASEAEPFLVRAIELAPTRPEPLLGLARLYANLGRTDDAIDYAERAAKLAPNHPAAAYIQASALERAYRHAAARAPADRLLGLLPDDRNALAMAARIRGVLGDPTGALAAADRLIAIDPGLDAGYYQRALALADLGRESESRSAQDKYLYYRVATEIDLAVRAKLRARRPSLPDESVPVHTHVLTRVGARR